MRAATAAGFVTIAIWGATLPWMRTISDDVGPVSSGAWMCIGGAIVLWCVRLVRGRGVVPRVSAKTATVNGALFAANLVCLSLAVGFARSEAESVTVALVNYTWPALAIVLGILRRGEKLSARVPVMVCVALAGMSIAVLGDGSVSIAQALEGIALQPLPYLAAAGSALTWSLYATNAEYGRRAGDENPVVVYLPLAALATGLLAWRIDGLALPSNTATWVSLTLLCCATAISYVCWDIALRSGDRRIVGGAALFIPVLSVIAAAVAFGSLPGPHVWIGAALLVVAAALNPTVDSR